MSNIEKLNSEIATILINRIRSDICDYFNNNNHLFHNYIDIYLSYLADNVFQHHVPIDIKDNVLEKYGSQYKNYLNYSDTLFISTIVHNYCLDYSYHHTEIHLYDSKWLISMYTWITAQSLTSIDKKCNVSLLKYTENSLNKVLHIIKKINKYLIYKNENKYSFKYLSNKIKKKKTIEKFISNTILNKNICKNIAYLSIQQK